MERAETAMIEALVALFERAGYARVDAPVLQPADIFVELSGEDIRRRMFSTQDASGRELCLRPEYTIPVCREHLGSDLAAKPAAYSYGGPVFRLRSGEPGEFLQAGLESIGRSDTAEADAEILALSLAGLQALGLQRTALRIKIGDMGLLGRLIDSLGIASAAKRRIFRAVVSGRGLDAAFRDSSEPGDASSDRAHAGLLAAIEGQAPQAARAFVEDVFSIAGISRVGGRSAADIANRFLARAAASRSGALPAGAREVIEAYLKVRSDPERAAAEIRAIARGAGLALEAALDAFEERNKAISARGLEPGAVLFAADFARNLDYYTGFIFEVAGQTGPEGRPLVGGGRYDRLLRHLGAPGEIPAVGCALWLDRIAKMRGLRDV